MELISYVLIPQKLISEGQAFQCPWEFTEQINESLTFNYVGQNYIFYSNIKTPLDKFNIGWCGDENQCNEIPLDILKTDVEWFKKTFEDELNMLDKNMPLDSDFKIDVKIGWVNLPED